MGKLTPQPHRAPVEQVTGRPHGVRHRQAELTRGFVQDMSERDIERRVSESKGGALEDMGQDALTCQQGGVGLLSEHEAKHQWGHGRDGGAVEGVAQCLGEFGIGDRIGCGHVHRPGQRRRIDRKPDRGDRVVDRDPAHPLRARPQLAPCAKLEGRQHPGERTAGATQDHAESRVHGSDPGIARRCGCALPRDTDFGEKIGADCAALVEDRVAAVAVDPDSGPGNQHPRCGTEPGDRSREQRRPIDAARGDRPLVRGGPPRIDWLTGQVDDDVNGAERCRIEKSPHRVPMNDARHCARALPSRDSDHLAAGFGECRRESGPNESQCAGDRDPSGAWAWRGSRDGHDQPQLPGAGATRSSPQPGQRNGMGPGSAGTPRAS